MNTDTVHRPFARTLVLMLLAVALAVIGTSVAPADTPRRAEASSVGGPITGSEILARAQNWVDRGITYTQTGPWASDIDGGHTYRRDCSGLVSMAWHLGSSLITHEFLNKARNNDGMHVIPLDALQPGDAMVRDSDGAGQDGHMELFSHWANPADHGQGAYVYSFNSDGETVRNPYRVNNVGLLGKNSDSEMRTYTPIRYNKTVAEGGGVNHRVRNADGLWSPFGGLGLNASQVAVAADPGGRTHVLAVSSGQLHHRLRSADGSWTPWGLLGNPGTASSVSASTDDGGNLQVAFVADGTFYHRIRFVGDGSWTASNLVGVPAGTTAASVSIAIDTSRSVAHVTTVANGQVFHRIRNTDGTWTPWGPLGNGGTAVSSATDTSGHLHLALVSNGTIYHRLRNGVDGSWTFTNLLGAPAGTASAISVAGDPVSSVVHVMTVANGQLFHRVRNSDGSWTPWGQLGNPGTATAVSTSVDPNQTLHLAATY